MASARGSFNFDESKQEEWNEGRARGSFRLMSFAFDQNEVDEKIEGKSTG